MRHNKSIRERTGAAIVFVGQFPPPTDGLTLVTSRLASALIEAGHELTVADIGGRGAVRSPLYHVSRLARIFRALGLIAAQSRRRGPGHCYLAVDGGLGLVYSLVIAGFARLCGFRLFLHHHSYGYVDAWRPLMSCLLALVGVGATHICLSERMARDLGARYRRDLRTFVLSYAAFVSAAAPIARRPARAEVTIGLLGNLTPDKGLHAFIEIMRLARERGLPIRGVLAGPILLESDQRFLRSVVGELAGWLDYRGAVYGGDKARFYQDVDVFVFASAYRNEAQPVVVYEALANGVPVISVDRGCVRDQVAEAGFVFEPDADFVGEALLALAWYLARPDALAAHRRAARSRHEEDRRIARTRIVALFAAPPVAVNEAPIRGASLQ